MKVAGRWRYRYRPVDQFGQVIDVLVSRKRDKTAARRFCTGARAGATSPTEVSTDRAPAYPRIVEDICPTLGTAPSSTRTTVLRCDTKSHATSGFVERGTGRC